MAKNSKVEEAEVIPEPNGKPEPEDKLTAIINKSLIKHNVTDAFINELLESSKDLTINGVDDKAGYVAVHDARMKYVKARGLFKSVCELGREDAVAIQKKWVSKQKELIERISPEENRLDKLESDVDAEKDRVKQERLENERLRLKTRMSELLAMGAINDGVDVYLDGVSFSVTDIRESDEEDYQSDILPQYKNIFDAKEKVRLENERVEKEKQDKLDNEKAEFDRQQKEFRKKQEEFENEKKEAVRIKRESRIAQIAGLGMTAEYPSGDMVYRSVRVQYGFFETSNDEEWSAKYILVKSLVEMEQKAEQDQREKAEKERLEDARKKAAAELRFNSRVAQLKGMQFGMSGVTNWDMYRGRPIKSDNHIPLQLLVDYDDNKWNELVDLLQDIARSEDIILAQELRDKILQEETDRKERERMENEEKAEQASDKEKWTLFLNRLNGVVVPTMKRQPYKDFAETAEVLIKKINGLKK
jgi:hypothetical protein